MEAVFVEQWARAVVPPLSRMVGVVPVPVVEVAAGAYLLRRGWTVARSGRALGPSGRSRGRVLLSGLAVGLRDMGIALILFYLLWGFHYARPPAAERLELPALEEVEEIELERLAGQMITLANQSYVDLHGSGDAGAPTTLPEDRIALWRSLERGWARAAVQLPLDPLATARYGPPKALVVSPLAAYFGVTGFYSPFTAEPLVVGTTPAARLGLTLAHEQAHQRGITHEGEATFLGFVAASESGHPLLRYSAFLRAGSRILSALARRDTTAARRVAERRIPGVVRDLEDLRDYSRRHRGPLSRLTHRVNDAYLRANRVAGGVESYDRATRLLLRYARLRGGDLSPDEGPAVRVPTPTAGGD